MDNNQKIHEAYLSIVEGSEVQVAKAIEKLFGVKVKKTEVKCKTILKLSGYVDEAEMDNWQKIDALTKFIKSKYKDAIVEFKGTIIEIEEL